jgi:hypothetical protein
MKRIFSSIIFLIVTHTMCFSLKASEIDIDIEELNRRKDSISEKYEECKRREELPEYESNSSFREETEKLRSEADDGMMDLAKAGYVEARIWREKRELQLLECHRDAILSNFEDAKNNLKEKENGILINEVSKFSQELQDICEHLNDCEYSLKHLKKLKNKKTKIVRDTQYYRDNNICPFLLFDEDEKDEDEKKEERKSPVPALQVVPVSAQVTYDYVDIFKRTTRKTLNELVELETDLVKLPPSKAEEAREFIKRIRNHINQNGYLDSQDDQSDDFVGFIFSIIRESTDYSYAAKPSFRAIGRVRDVLFSALIRLSDENVTSIEILMSLTNCLLTPSNKHNIQDKIDCWKAELQLVGEIRRYLGALTNPDQYAKLVYKKLYESKNKAKIMKYYLNDSDYDSCVYVDSLVEPAEQRFFTLQTFFINDSYNPYKGLVGAAMTDFMDFGRKNFKMQLADIQRYVKNQSLQDCPYYVRVQPKIGKPVQTILVSKKSPYSIRYHHELKKLTIGYLQTYPYDKHNDRWIANSSGDLVCDGSNEIIKYARYDVFNMVAPANRLHEDGFLNAASYGEESAVLALAHF